MLNKHSRNVCEKSVLKWYTFCQNSLQYSNKQLVVHGKVDHNILVMKKTKSFAISMYVKGDINLDIA